jgi:BlaI family transcriptional regulator, penicillinase repressor
MKAPKNLGELQLAILRVLWSRDEAAVADVHAALADRGLALTTIATMLRKMEDKRLVKHRENGRQFLYRSLVAPESVHKHMVGDLVDRLFDGDPLALVSHLVQEGEIDLDELEQLRARVRAAASRQPKEGER